MGLFSKIFGGGSSVDGDVKQACDSDVFSNIAKLVNGNKAKYNMAIEYLTKQDNIGMKIRIMTLPIADSNALMAYLMSLEPSQAPKINKLNKDGLNPVLHFSMCKGMEVFIRLLAHAHANLDVVGLNGHTPLTMACENGLAETVKMLLANGAKAVNKCDDSGWSPLHYACQLGSFEIVEALVKAKANVNALSSDKLMPIHLAISTSQAARTSPTAPNGVPWTVKGAVQCVQLLANSGADMDYVCPYGFSAMSFLRRIGAVR